MNKMILVSAFAGLLCTVSVANASMITPIYHQIRSISLPGNEGWDYLFLDSGARRLYISRSTHVQVVDVDSGALVGDIPDTEGVHGIAIDDRSHHGFTSNGRANTVTEFDTRSLAKIGDIPVGNGPDCIIFDPATERVFTFNGQSGTSTAIDARRGKVVGTVTLPGRPEYAVADGKGHIYNNITDKSEIAQIDSRNLAVENIWPLAPGEGPSGIAMDRKRGIIFSVCDNQYMVALDASSGKVIATPAIGNGPDACLFDADYGIAFSPNGRDGTLTEVVRNPYEEETSISGITVQPYTVSTTAPTQVGARTAALDQKTQHVFTVTATPAPPNPADSGNSGPGGMRRRGYVAGSFVLLELAPEHSL